MQDRKIGLGHPARDETLPGRRPAVFRGGGVPRRRNGRDDEVKLARRRQHVDVVIITYTTSTSDADMARLGRIARHRMFRPVSANMTENAPKGIEVFASAVCPCRPPMISSAQWIQKSTSTVSKMPKISALGVSPAACRTVTRVSVCAFCVAADIVAPCEKSAAGFCGASPFFYRTENW